MSTLNARSGFNPYSSTGTSYSWSLALGAGTGRKLVVFVSSVAAGDKTINGVTYDGTPMTEFLSDTSFRNFRGFYLDIPDAKGAASYNVTPSFVRGDFDLCSLNSYGWIYNGCPVGEPLWDAAAIASGTAIGTSLAGATDDAMIAVIGTGSSSNYATVNPLGSYAQSGGSVGGWNGKADRIETGSGTVACDWTINASDVAFAFQVNLTQNMSAPPTTSNRGGINRGGLIR